MNIFYLHNDTVTCAEQHVDKHVVKMILEYAQLLSTAHRILDGTELPALTATGRKKKVWKLPDDRDSVLYTATHANHPSAIWVRQSDKNYDWLYDMFQSLLSEYTYRYGKIHACSRLENALGRLPNNIPQGPFTEPTPAMPDYCKVAGDSIKSYRNYYINEKKRMAQWRSRSIPEWFTDEQT